MDFYFYFIMPIQLEQHLDVCVPLKSQLFHINDLVVMSCKKDSQLDELGLVFKRIRKISICITLLYASLRGKYLNILVSSQGIIWIGMSRKQLVFTIKHLNLGHCFNFHPHSPCN